MKFLSKISIFLLSAAIFMSAFVVFAGSQDNEMLDWPYLQFNIIVSEENRIQETDSGILLQKASNAASVPFFALARDFPDITMWSTGISFAPLFEQIFYGNKTVYNLKSYKYTIKGNSNYGDPNGMLGQLRDIVDGFSPSGTTMYDKLVSIHDFICQMNTYVSAATYCYSAYGALVDGKSVCEGYAEAFKLLCDKAGFDCILVTGMSLPDDDDMMEAHMWNLVRMDDGEWYGVDVTWDDAGDISGNYNYFLVGNDTVIRGRTFEESHLTCYDFIEIGGSGKTITDLEYPTLSDIAYDIENGKTEYAYGGERFHYNFLDDLQKEIYDKILAELQSNMPSDPSKTPNYETTDNSVTTPSQTTTGQNDTTTEDTTSQDITTSVDTTTSEDTTTPEETTEETDETTTDATETDPLNTTSSGTTEPPVSSTQKETEPPKSDTTQKPDTTVKDSENDTTRKPNTTVSTTTVPQTATQHDRQMYNLYKAATTVVIICAISSLSIILGIVVIRYAKKHKN